MAKRRRRGVVLTPEGQKKFHDVRLQHETEHNWGDRYTYEKLSEITCLDINTIKRVIKSEEGVDKRTLEQLFISFEMELTESCYTKPNPHRRQNWGEAMCVNKFYGRHEELTALESLLLRDHCRIVTMLGMGGVGKTCLSVKLAEQVQERFDLVIWCSLRDAPPISEILHRIIEFFSDGKETPADLPESLKDKISHLINYLRESRCLIVLDNVEAMLCSGKRAGQFREGCEGYGDLLLRVGQTSHQSTLILTTREKPKQVAFLEGEELPVRTFRIHGLAEEAGEQILLSKGLTGTEWEYKALVDHYGGNALALKVVATTVRDLFLGNIRDFLEHETAVFGDIRDLLEQQFERLTDVEKEIVYWLAINREPLAIADVREDMVSTIPKLTLLEGLESLSRRSLVEQDESRFTLQNVVMEYVISRFIERVCQELISLQLQLFRFHAVIKATAKDYVRETQIRLILEPILQGLMTSFRSEKNIEQQLKKVLTLLRTNFSNESCYAGGNVLNMLCHMETDFTGYDFSHLAIWQADFRNSCFHNVDLSHCDLSKSVFAEAFGGIWSVAFSPDGEILAAGDTKGEIILRRVSDGQPIRSFKGHTGWVVSLDFSPDGKTLASSSCDCTARLWDVETSQCFHTLEEHEHEVWSVAFSPNGKMLATGCDDNKARLWNVNTGECLKIFEGHADYILAVSFNVNGLELLTGSHDNVIKLWDIETGECKKNFIGHDDGVRSLALCPDGMTFASCSNDKTVRIWNIDSGECITVFRGHSNAVWSVASCFHSNVVASGSIDQTVRLWNIDTGECLKIFQGHSNMINSIVFNPQSNLLASSCYDQTIRLWDTNTYECLKIFQGYSNQSLSVIFSSDGKTIASGGHDQKIRLWDISNGRILKTFEKHNNWVWSVALNFQGNLLASGSGDKTLKLWDVETGTAIKTLQGHEAVVRSIAFSFDGQMIASGSEDKTIRLWNIDTGQTVNILQGHTAEIWSISLTLDGQILASGSLDGTIKLWDTNTGKCLRTLEGHSSWVSSVALSSDNKTLASTSPDQTIRIWNIKTGQCSKILTEKRGYSHLVVFSKNGQTLATHDQSHNIKLWDTKTGKNFEVLSGHKALINSVSFSPDGNNLVSSSEDETIKIWNIKHGGCVKTLKPEKPYEGMLLEGSDSLTEATLDSLEALGGICTFSKFDC
ncbi:MAG: NB-ARC domain-containing protein [Cyanobacteria bacterium P01_C01_bin.72]